MGATTLPPEVTLQEHRQAEGLDADVPVLLRDGALYDPDLDRFFLDLPLSGIRSRHSLRAYGYDVVVWARFLAEARGKTVWAADRDDVAAFHRARRRGDADTRITAASWNRSVASLDRLYRWAERERLVDEVPFTHRAVWHRGVGGWAAAPHRAQRGLRAGRPPVGHALRGPGGLRRVPRRGAARARA